MVRQWVYRDYYHPDLTEGDIEEWSVHAGKRLSSPRLES
jgi:hypothetical protein